VAARERMVWLDALRLVAGVSMVGLHASSDATGQPFVAFEPAERVGPVLFRSIIYMARTELFIIISLFLLIMALEKRPRSYVETISQQVQRLLVPFMFWVIVFAFWRIIKANEFGYLNTILSEHKALAVGYPIFYWEGSSIICTSYQRFFA
jgi:surface polysaccharide O-acyltransferase-like enzyme